MTARKIGEAVADVVSPRGLRNNNPGNLRWSAANNWTGQTGHDAAGYAIFSEARWGVRALARNLRSYSNRGLRSVRAIIERWAPASENDTAAYVAAVARALRVSPDLPLDVGARLVDLAAAIIHHENGRQPYARADLAAWVHLP